MAHVGKQSMIYERPPRIASHVSVVGPKEGQGPLAAWFDTVLKDDLLGKKSWEMAESEMLRRCALDAAAKAGMPPTGVQAFMAGDLNAQIIASGFCARELAMPFVGMYGACSTFVEGLVTGSALISGGMLDNAICGASSHFCTAERQFRMPLEMGTQRTPSAQWTATAAGCALLKAEKTPGLHVTAGTIGRVIDYAVKDANHMGAAMAPAVWDCIRAHMDDTGRREDHYDMIVTGDLGIIGRGLLMELMSESGIHVPEEKLTDCGASLFSQAQDAHAGGSGCGCVAAVSCGWIMKRMEAGELKKVLLVGSGALLSTTSGLQGESIPSIAYAAGVEMTQ